MQMTRPPDPRLLSFLEAYDRTIGDLALALREIILDEVPDASESIYQVYTVAIWFGFQVGEISCPALYFAEASSINFRRSVKYGFGVLGTALEFRLARWGVLRSPRFAASGRKLPQPASQLSE